MFRPSSLLIIFIAFACSQKSNGDRSNAVPIPIKCYSMERAFFEALDSKDYRKYYDALFRLDHPPIAAEAQKTSELTHSALTGKT